MPRLKARFESNHAMVAVAILLLAFAVRVKGIGGIDLGLDGGLSVALARMPFRDALTFLAHDVHPPLFYSGLRLWVWLVGTTPFAIKFLGLLMSTLAVAATMGWIRLVVGGRGALLAGLTLAVAPAALDVSASVREFGPAVTLMVLAAWAYTRWARRSRLTFVALSALALWTSYAAVAVPVGAAIDAIARRSWRRLVVSAIAGATILPWLGYVVSQGFLDTLGSAGPRQNAVASPPLLSQVRDVAVILTGSSFLEPPLLGPTVVGAVLIVFVVYLTVDRAFPRQRRAMLSGQGIFLGAAIVASLFLAVVVNTTWTREGMTSRYVLPALPFILVVVAAAIQAASVRRPVLIAVAGIIPVVGLAGVFGWYARPTLPLDYWNPTATVGFLDDHVGTSDDIVFTSAEQAGYYAVLSRQPRSWSLVSVGTDYLAGDIHERTARVFPPIVGRSNVVWLLLWKAALGSGTAQVGDWLSLHEFAMEPFTTSDSEIDPYLTTAGVSARPDPVGVAFDAGVRLVVADWPSTIHAGAPLPVQLDWTATGPLDRNYTVFVHLVDATGNVWAQHDGWPVNGRAPTTTWQEGRLVEDRYALALPSNLPASQFWLEVGLYDDRGRLARLSGGDTVRLGPIVVQT